MVGLLSTLAISPAVEKMIQPEKKLINQEALLLIVLLAVVSFFAICLLLNQFYELNQSVNLWMVHIQTGAFTQIAVIVAQTFDTFVLIGLTVPLVALLVYKKQGSNALLLASAMGLDVVLLQFFKMFVDSSRPLNGLMVEQGSSFPSGHVTSTIVFVGVLSYIVLKNRKSLPLKVSLVALTSGLAALVGLDRLYLNVHWLTDVLAALFLAIFILMASILTIQKLTTWYTKKASAPSNLVGSYHPGAVLCLEKRALYGRAITTLQYSLKGVKYNARKI